MGGEYWVHSLRHNSQLPCFHSSYPSPSTSPDNFYLFAGKKRLIVYIFHIQMFYAWVSALKTPELRIIISENMAGSVGRAYDL